MNMKRIMLLIAVLALAGVGIANAQEKTEPAGKPKLVLESFSHDFGTVAAGTPLTYTFKVKNEGNADLTILSVAPS
ncbi:MAG: DUF1573 domain-containing protein [Blastocatellia bacterium]